jgi:hypothetical protein
MPNLETSETSEPAQPPVLDPEVARLSKTSDDFLVPGPTPTSNEGLRRWGCTWLAFSVALILLMLLITYVCWLLARVTGAA